VSLQLVATDLPNEKARQHRTIIATAVNALTKAQRRTESPSVEYAPSITFDAATGGTFIVTVTDNVNFTINAPVNGEISQRMLVVIRNTSGGAMGAITWNAAFKKTAFTNPANAFSRSIQYVFDGTNWVEFSRGAADVPN
jgi:hypothetical protein